MISYFWKIKTLLVIGLLLLIIAIIRVDALRFDYYHPDEIIAVKVTEQVLNSGRLDTNWQHADLPEIFKYPQYNFSGYMLFASAVLKGVQAFGFDNTLHILRYLSALLGLIAVMLTYFLGRQWFNQQIALFATLLVAVNPLLFQDALYARPETLLTCLTLGLLWVTGVKSLSEKRRLLLAALLLGFCVGIKLSMLAFTPLLFLPLTVKQSRLMTFITTYFIELWCRWWLVLCGVLLGFLLAVPYAIVNIEGFLNGFHFLSHQYNGGHWPHGLFDGTISSRFLYALGYFVPTMGALLWLLVIMAGVFLLKSRQYRLLGIWGIAVVFFVIFATYRTFFERNFSHLLPIFCLFAAYVLVVLYQLISKWFYFRQWRTAGLVILLVAVRFPSVRLSVFLYQTILPGYHDKQVGILRNQLQKTYGVQAYSPGFISNWQWLSSLLAVPNCTAELLEYWSVGDRYTKMLPQKLIASGFQMVGHINSPFDQIVPSTLHTYFAQATTFFYRPFDEARCRAAKQNMLTEQSIGQYLPIKIIRQDKSWSLAGGYGKMVSAFGDNAYYASWSGDDRHMGILQWRLDLQNVEQVVLPIAAGPNADKQIVTIIDEQTQRTLWKSQGQMRQTWRVHRFDVPKDVKSVIVTAEDNGDGWGEWLAVGLPRQAFMIGKHDESKHD